MIPSTFGLEEYKRYKEDLGLTVIEELNLFILKQLKLWEKGQEAFTCSNCEEINDKRYECSFCQDDLCENCGIIEILKDTSFPQCLDCAKNNGYPEEELEPGIRHLD